jgi:AcrR family transcriptional regulator
LASHPAPTLTPRKSPVQERSSATVEAILQATIQVLLKEGKERLTTTRVAARAGVSVGTLYQYFPNKKSLLQAVLRRHLEEVSGAVERVCREQTGKPLAEMVPALIHAFLTAKMRDPKASAALYSVSSDVDGFSIARQLSNRFQKSVVAMLVSSPEPLTRAPELVADVLLGAVGGVCRKLIESPAPEKHFPALRQELLFLAEVYVQACCSTAAAA